MKLSSTKLLNLKANPCYFNGKITFSHPNNALNDEQKEYLEKFDDGNLQDSRYLGEGVI